MKIQKIKDLFDKIIEGVQRVYAEWDESDLDTYAGGGICHLIADEICDILLNNDIECCTISFESEQHMCVAIKYDGVYLLDIPYDIYETGSTYRWKKRKGITFTTKDIFISKISNNPEEYSQYCE